MDSHGKGGVSIFFTIPNLFTLLNLGFGFLGLYYAILGRLLDAFIFVLLAIIADGLDGFIARKLKATSEIGRELDSLCDQVSFGVTPAIMLISAVLDSEYIIFALIAGAIYSGFGALRLARFNIYGSKEFFEGLAIPAAAFFECLVILCILPLNEIACIILTVATAVLMISSIAFPSAKTRAGIKTIAISIAVGAIYFLIFIAIIPSILASTIGTILWGLLSIMLSYVTTSPIIFMIAKK